MNIKNIEVEDYIENLDGSIDGVELLKDMGEGYGLFEREDGRGFVILNYGCGEDEYVWSVV